MNTLAPSGLMPNELGKTGVIIPPDVIGGFGTLLTAAQQQLPSKRPSNLQHGPLLHAGAPCESLVLEDILTQLQLLVSFSAQQAARTEELQRQFSEHARLASSAAQSVLDLKSQVNAMRQDMSLALRGAGDFEAAFHSARHIEERRNSKPQPPSPSAGAVGMLTDGAKASSASGMEVHLGVGQFARRSALGFVRSPPGLSCFPPSSGGAASAPESLDRLPPVAAAAPPLPTTSAAAAAVGASSAAVTGTGDGAGGAAADARSFFAAVRSGDPAPALRAVLGASEDLVNEADGDSMTALHYAALLGNAALCRAILGRGDFRCVRSEDKNGDTALHIAALHDYGDACDAILSFDSACSAVVNRFGETPGDVARRRGVEVVCKAFRAHAFGAGCAGEATSGRRRGGGGEEKAPLSGL